MSLVNPLNRWWNRKPVRRALGWACWIIGAIGAAAGAAGSAIEMDYESGITVAPWLIPVGMVVAMAGFLGGLFLHIIGSDSDDFDARLITHPIGVAFLIFGLVPTVYALATGRQPDLTFVIFAVAAALLLVLAEIFIRRAAANRSIRAEVQRRGVRTSGVVTRATSYQQDYSRVTRVTVKFVDGEGRDRWASASIGGGIALGAHVTVRYLPSALGRRAGVVIERR